MGNTRVLPHVCLNPKCRKLILPPFTEELLCEKCKKEESVKSNGRV